MKKVWLLRLTLPNGMPVYLTELLGTGNAALVGDPYLAINFTKYDFAVQHLNKCRAAAPPEVHALVECLTPHEMEFLL